MTTKQELYKILDNLNELQLDYAKKALTNIMQGKIVQKVPVCDLGSPQDIATLCESVTYDKNNKM